MNFEELSNAIVNARKFTNHDDLEIFVHATEQIMGNFKYENFKFLLLGFDDNTNDPTVMSNILTGCLNNDILDDNPVQYSRQLLMHYELMLPQAEDWLSILLTGPVILDENIFKIYIEELNLLQVNKKEKLKNIYLAILGNEIKLLERPINEKETEFRKKVIKKIEHILEVLDAES